MTFSLISTTTKKIIFWFLLLLYLFIKINKYNYNLFFFSYLVIMWKKLSRKYCLVIKERKKNIKRLSSSKNNNYNS